VRLALVGLEVQERCGGALAKAGRSPPTPPTSLGRRVAVVDEEGREIGTVCRNWPSLLTDTLGARRIRTPMLADCEPAPSGL